MNAAKFLNVNMFKVFTSLSHLCILQKGKLEDFQNNKMQTFRPFRDDEMNNSRKENNEIQTFQKLFEDELINNLDETISGEFHECSLDELFIEQFRKLNLKDKTMNVDPNPDNGQCVTIASEKTSR